MMQKEIVTDEGAAQKIADLMRAKYADPALTAELSAAITEVQRIYAVTIFPERKADWRVYPNNIGHKDWLGCFRCHDNNHKTAQGQAVRSSDCNSCHTLLAQGTGAQLDLLSVKGLEFAHPGGELDVELTCSDCHNGAIQK
jgi:ribosomal protein S27E